MSRHLLNGPRPPPLTPRRHRLPARRSSDELTRNLLSVVPDVTDERTPSLNGKATRITPSGTTSKAASAPKVKPSWSDHIRFIRLELYWAIARVLLVRSLLRSSSTDRAIGVFRGVI